MNPSTSPVHITTSPNLKEDTQQDTAAISRKSWTFIISGLLISIPWGVIMNSIDLFEHHLRGTSYGEAFLSHFASVYLLTKLVFMFIALRAHRHIGMSPRSQCLVGAFGILCVMILFFVLVLIAPCLSPLVFYLIVLSASVGASLSAGVLEAGVYVLAGQAHAINAVLIGQSSSALFCSVISFIFIAALSHMKASLFALGNFGIAIFISLSTIFLMAQSTLGSSNPHDVATEDETSVKSRQVLRKCFKECGSIFLAALLSTIVAVFLISKTWSTSETPMRRILFRPLGFLLMALADLASKLLPLNNQFRFLNLPVIWITLGRIALVPVFLFGNVRSSSGKATALPNFLANDYLYYICLLGFSFIGGYTATVASIQATLRVQDHERGRASFLVGASGLAGALTGAIISAVVSAMLFK